MKRFVSICLATILLFLCIPIDAYAIIPGEDSIADSIASTHTPMLMSCLEFVQNY